MPTTTKQQKPQEPKRLTMKEKMAKVSEPESGGGFIGLFKIEAGYKIFVQGLTNEESFAAFDPGDDEAREAALEAMREQLHLSGDPTDTKGRKLRPQKSVQLVLYRDSIKNREVTWQQDREWTFPTWTDSYAKVLHVSIMKFVESGQLADYGVDTWGRISFAKDPTGRQKKNEQTGEMQDVLVPVIAEIYASEEEAEAAVGSEVIAQNPNGAEPTLDSFATAVAQYKKDNEFEKLVGDMKATAQRIKIKAKRDAALVDFALQNITDNENDVIAHWDEIHSWIA